ncbi:MAG: AAA-associated domain-containing protein [Acidobacteriota bacterium]
MDVDPLPLAEISRILGLLEILDDHGGRQDIYKLAKELQFESSDLVDVIRGAETLGLVTTPGGDVDILESGTEVAKGDANTIKAILRSRMLEIPLFQYVKGKLEEEEDHQMPRRKVEELLTQILPTYNPEEQFLGLVNWGRYAEIFGYNRDHDIFYLDEGQTLE